MVLVGIFTCVASFSALQLALKHQRNTFFGVIFGYLPEIRPLWGAFISKIQGNRARGGFAVVWTCFYRFFRVVGVVTRPISEKKPKKSKNHAFEHVFESRQSAKNAVLAYRKKIRQIAQIHNCHQKSRFEPPLTHIHPKKILGDVPLSKNEDMAKTVNFWAQKGPNVQKSRWPNLGRWNDKSLHTSLW